MRSFRGLLCLVLATSVAACAGGSYAPDFTLRDDTGVAWTLSQQRGEAVLLTFGFTHCTDTCPATLAKLMRSSNGLSGAARNVEVAFVTVDPVRDTAPVMHRFIGKFAPLGPARLVGLTGTPAAIEHVEAAYHVWSAPMKDGIAHSAVIFLIDPHGRIAAIRDDES